MRNGTILTGFEGYVYDAVAKLQAAGRSVNNSQLANETGYSRSMIASATQTLCMRGYIKNTGKGNAYHWRVTSKGRETAAPPPETGCCASCGSAPQITTCRCGKTVVAGPGVPAGITCPRCEGPLPYPGSGSHQNDTYGELSDEQLANAREGAKKCLRCGMLATVDPILHESRYGHAPVVKDGTGELVWSGDGFSWIAHEPPADARSWDQRGEDEVS